MNNQNKKQESDRKLQVGITLHYKGVKSISFAGRDYKPADIQALLQTNIDSWNASDRARLASRNAVATARASEEALAPVRSAFIAYLVAILGPSSPTLADFGIAPKKERRKLSTEEKLLAVARSRATRDARGTKGTRQRASIHGEVPAPVVATPATPTAPVVTNGAPSVLSLNGVGHS